MTSEELKEKARGLDLFRIIGGGVMSIVAGLALWLITSAQSDIKQLDGRLDGISSNQSSISARLDTAIDEIRTIRDTSAASTAFRYTSQQATEDFGEVREDNNAQDRRIDELDNRVRALELDAARRNGTQR